jgi:hypothetical protein
MRGSMASVWMCVAPSNTLEPAAIRRIPLMIDPGELDVSADHKTAHACCRLSSAGFGR